MIFVTVGSQMPFDRLIRAVDDWAGSSDPREPFAQIGPGGRRPQHIAWTEFIGPREYRSHVQQARVVVSHAGMGSILTALELGRPILVMPRRAALRETRNDHQVATARQFQSAGQVHVAYDEDELIERLAILDKLSGAAPISPVADPKLIATLQRFIHETPQAQSMVAGPILSRWRRLLAFLRNGQGEAMPLSEPSRRWPER